MKINEFKPIAQEQKPCMNQQKYPDFSSWLDVPAKETNQVIDWAKAGRPTKQNSGDEYYWQHQNQLQHSNLHFNAKHQVEQQQKQRAPHANNELFNSVKSQKETSQSSFSNLQNNEVSLTFKNSTPTNPKLLLIFNELQQALEQSPVNIIGNNELTQELLTQHQIRNRANDVLSTSTHFKNSHLFISGEQAELTLNLQHSNKQEQKELIQMIQEHLKKKGLVISRLIINGVNK